MPGVQTCGRNWSTRLGSNSDDSVRNWTKPGNGLKSILVVSRVQHCDRNWSTRLGSNSDDSVRHWTKKPGNGLKSIFVESMTVIEKAQLNEH